MYESNMRLAPDIQMRPWKQSPFAAGFVTPSSAASSCPAQGTSDMEVQRITGMLCAARQHGPPPPRLAQRLTAATSATNHRRCGELRMGAALSCLRVVASQLLSDVSGLLARDTDLQKRQAVAIVWHIFRQLSERVEHQVCDARARGSQRHVGGTAWLLFSMRERLTSYAYQTFQTENELTSHKGLWDEEMSKYQRLHLEVAWRRGAARRARVDGKRWLALAGNALDLVTCGERLRRSRVAARREGLGLQRTLRRVADRAGFLIQRPETGGTALGGRRGISTSAPPPRRASLRVPRCAAALAASRAVSPYCGVAAATADDRTDSTLQPPDWTDGLVSRYIASGAELRKDAAAKAPRLLAEGKAKPACRCQLAHRRVMFNPGLNPGSGLGRNTLDFCCPIESLVTHRDNLALLPLDYYYIRPKSPITQPSSNNCGTTIEFCLISKDLFYIAKFKKTAEHSSDITTS
ncbi:Protein of unknown function [Gryllus bimaculatus]|nr:Protein of unknown function [Gryllus bimaculatus]